VQAFFEKKSIGERLSLFSRRKPLCLLGMLGALALSLANRKTQPLA
jgi:hypothetical protein